VPLIATGLALRSIFRQRAGRFIGMQRRRAPKVAVAA
jgi:hypothetical protein